MKYLFIILLLVFFIACNGDAQTKIVVPYCDTCEVLWFDGTFHWDRDTFYTPHPKIKLNISSEFKSFNDKKPDIQFDSTIYIMSGYDVMLNYAPQNYVEQRITGTDTIITVVGDSLNAIKLLFKAWNDLLISYQQQDSIKYYWKKYNYFKKKLGEAVDQMNAPAYPAMDEKIFRLEDSCRKYKLLLDRIKK